MANMNAKTPRWYCDYINYRLSRGIAQNGNYDVQATSTGNNLVGIKSGGGTEAELFDMKPLNLVTFDTSASSAAKADHVVISLDVMGESDSKVSFVAILNHNLATATGKIRISASDTKSHIENDDLTSATTITCTEVVNADTISTNIITPATDGSTIVRFSESDLRYWGIQFEGSDSGNFSSTDLTVGCILIGEYFDAPNAPDLSINRSIIFDKVNLTESIGGQRYSNMSSHGGTASSASKSPFSTATAGEQIFGGRMAYDLNFSFLASSDLMPDEYDIYNPTDDSFVEDVWNRVNGPHIPYIFSVDNSSEGDNAESEHLFARFANNSLDMSQVANDFWNVSMRIEEEF